jgi:hypothetical protein
MFPASAWAAAGVAVAVVAMWHACLLVSCKHIATAGLPNDSQNLMDESMTADILCASSIDFDWVLMVRVLVMFAASAAAGEAERPGGVCAQVWH